MMDARGCRGLDSQQGALPMIAEWRTDRVVHVPPGKPCHCDAPHVHTHHHVAHNQPLVHYGVAHPALHNNPSSHSVQAETPSQDFLSVVVAS